MPSLPCALTSASQAVKQFYKSNYGNFLPTQAGQLLEPVTNKIYSI